MNITTILIIVNVFAAVAMIALTLMQSSKGDMGSAFGGGGSQSMFGSRGSSNFLSKSTAIMCTVFFLSSLALAYTYAQRVETSIVDTSVVEESNNEVPSINVPNIDEANEVPSIEVPQLEGALDEAQSSLDEIKDQVESVIEQEKAKAAE